MKAAILFALLCCCCCYVPHSLACTYFATDGFKAKAATYKTDVASAQCKAEVDGYANRDTRLGMVDSNGGLCGYKYFIIKYYCSKKCSELCPDRNDKKMLYVKCKPFVKLDEEGATADQVAFSCMCKYYGATGFCEVPETTWDLVESEYETSCIAAPNATSTSTTPTAPTITTTTSVENATATGAQTAPGTSATNATATAASTTTTTMPSTTTTASTTTTTTTAAPTTTTVPSTTTTTTSTTTAASTTTATVASSGEVWETLDGMMTGIAERETIFNMTMPDCEGTCAEYAGALGECKSLVFFQPDDAAPYGICEVLPVTRFDMPIAYSLESRSWYYTPTGSLMGTYLYVGLCNGGAEQCGVQPTPPQLDEWDMM